MAVLSTRRENTGTARGPSPLTPYPGTLVDSTTNARKNGTRESRHSIKARTGEQDYSRLENEVEYLSNRSLKIGSEKGS